MVLQNAYVIICEIPLVDKGATFLLMNNAAALRDSFDSHFLVFPNPNKRNPKKKILFFQMRTIISWSYNAENFFWMQKGILPNE